MSKIEEDEVCKQIKQDRAQSDKEREERLQQISTAAEKIYASWDAHKRHSLQVARSAVSDKLAREQKSVKQRLLLCDSLKEQYRLLLEKQEGLVNELEQNKLHKKFRHLSVEHTPHDHMWKHYDALDASEIEPVYEYQLIRELLHFYSSEIGRVGAFIEAAVNENGSGMIVSVAPETAVVQPVPSQVELPVDATTIEPADEQKAMLKGEVGRPKNKKVDKTYFELFQDRKEAETMLRVLLDRGIVEASYKDSKRNSKTLTDDQLRAAVFMWIGTSDTKSEIVAFVQELINKDYLKPSSTREKARVFNSFFQVNIDVSAYRKKVNNDFESYYKKFVPKRSALVGYR